MTSIYKKPKYSVPVSLRAIRNNLIDKLLKGAFIIALIGAPASSLRFLSTGWLHLYSLHIIVALIVIIIYLFRKRIPFHIKSLFLLSMFAFIGVLGLFSLGILGAGVWWLIMTCFLVSTLYSLRAGILTVLIATLLVSIAGYCYSRGIITLPVDANTYVKSASSWISFLIATSVMPFVVFKALASFQHATISLLNEVNRQKQIIENLATHDQLTGLFLLNEANERLDDAIENAKKSETKIAVLFIDLDGFKQVNDNFGHDAGDQVLIQVADRMLKTVHNLGLVCRIGGDEFLVILSDIDSDNRASVIAQKIIDEISKPYNYSGNEISIGSSIGISFFPDHAENTKLLRKLADKAMYSVKQSGKNGFAIAKN